MAGGKSLCGGIWSKVSERAIFKFMVNNFFFFICSYRKIVLRALPNLKKLDNVEVTPEEVRDAVRAPVDMPQQPQQQQQQQIKEDPYDDDFEQSYRQQAASSGFRVHSPVREVGVVFCLCHKQFGL